MKNKYIKSKLHRVSADTNSSPLVGYFENVVKCGCGSPCNQVYNVDSYLVVACSLECAEEKIRRRYEAN